jgi:PAS domain S-box-containing protein
MRFAFRLAFRCLTDSPLTSNRIRAVLRGKHGSDLRAALTRELERIDAAALAADNFMRYIAVSARACALTGFSSAELLKMTVIDATPLPRTEEGRQLWQEFIAHGLQRGVYELRRKDGTMVSVRYWAYASVAPGVHISLLVPTDNEDK